MGMDKNTESFNEKERKPRMDERSKREHKSEYEDKDSGYSGRPMRPDSRDSRDSYNEERHREKPRAKKEDSPPTKKIEEKEVVQPKKDIVNSWKSEEFTRSWADDDPYEEEIEKLSEPIMEKPERPDEKSS